MRRVQIHLDDDLDRAAAAEARRRGISKAALIREALAAALEPRPSDHASTDPWEAMAGWMGADPDPTPVDIDEIVYGRKG